MKKPALIHGVTGSGKTELYVRFLEPLLEQEKQAIFLVPEIALTPQMVSYFRSRLQKPVAVLHSGLSSKERRETWLGIAKGVYSLIIGARSAVFAPTPNLGAIIISVRRFLLRPSVVSLSATGKYSPLPEGTICIGLTPYSLVNIRTTEVARITLKSQLSAKRAV